MWKVAYRAVWTLKKSLGYRTCFLRSAGISLIGLKAPGKMAL
ncbi:MAG: hypothetical protein A4E64_00476 [Syntrophorhabdus sp. PtaU1.Bin058]|nr:MAG: hypothetical protein A4E64_00476 [Syntrophorhabdus sp. PtaU1.Bin058]